MKIINIYLAYNKLNMNCNNYDKFFKKSFNIICFANTIVFFGIKGFFNGIKNSSFFFNLTTLLSFYRQSEILFFRSTFRLYFLKRRWKYKKKKFIQCTLTMMSKVAGQSRQLPDIVWTEKFSLAFSSDKLKVDSFTFIH